jgi:methionine synthase I (cobalamin-dependent)
MLVTDIHPMTRVVHATMERLGPAAKPVQPNAGKPDACNSASQFPTKPRQWANVIKFADAKTE